MVDDKKPLDELLSNDPEMTESFIAEAKEHLDTIEDDFLNLEKQKDNPDRALLDKVFRAIHSVKGAAGFLGLGKMTDLAHVMETLLAKMRKGEIRPELEYIDALLAGVDLLADMLDDVAHSNNVDITMIHNRLSNLIGLSSLDQEPTPSRSVEQQPAESVKGNGIEIPVLYKSGVDFGSTIRIPVDILDKLMVQAGELVLVRNQHLLSVDESDPISRSTAHRLDLVTTELQETIISTRMQPIGKIFGKFPRIVRDIGKKLGKQIEITISGSEAELDKTILESLTDAMTHIIRNCCGHGIETLEERVRVKKPKTGRITLSAYHEAGRVNIDIKDDGKGIDPEIMRKKVLEKKLKTEAELDQMTDKEIMYLIFLPGFTTVDEAGDVTGRGVGMDVVKTAIEKLGGSFDLESTVGEGTTIHLRLPLTLAIIPSLIVMSGENLYAIPQVNLVELVCLYDEDAMTKIECADDFEVYRIRDSILPLVRLSEVLTRPMQFTRDIRSEITAKHQKRQEQARQDFINAEGAKNGNEFAQTLNFAVLKAGNSRFGLIIDQILGTEEIVVKPMHWAMKSLKIYSGATIMGNGKTALILDVEGIAGHTGITAVDKVAEEVDRVVKDEDRQTVLLFKSGEKEQFAMPLPLIRRIEPISMYDIKQIGAREYIAVDGTSTLVLRLNHILNVTPIVEKEEMFLILPRHIKRPVGLVEKEEMFLILPRHIKRPVGLLISSLIDIEETAVELDVESYPADGLLGTDIIRESMTLFIDIYRLIEIIEPEGLPIGV